MEVAGGLREEGIVVGNTYDKYGSRNPVVRLLMKGFENSLDELVAKVSPREIHEVGCGEGYWTLRWAERGIPSRGSDFSELVVDIARSNAVERGFSRDAFSVKSVYDLSPRDDKAHLVVCCEVMEHLEHPQQALEALVQVADPYLVVSVPREPLWSILNMARGKYWGSLGNTPGHVQRWSQREFVSLVSKYFAVLDVRAPIPWTMLLCMKKGASAP